MSEPGAFLATVGRMLDAAAVPYAVIGGHAVNAWLEPRFTADVDVTVAADAAALARLRDALTAAGWRVSREHGAGQPSSPDFVRFERAAGEPPLELQAAKTELQRELVARARTTPAGVRVATVEDLIILKLIAHRPKDLADLAGLVALPGVDWTYVEPRARAWEVEALLRGLRGT